MSSTNFFLKSSTNSIGELYLGGGSGRRRPSVGGGLAEGVGHREQRWSATVGSRVAVHWGRQRTVGGRVREDDGRGRIAAVAVEVVLLPTAVVERLRSSPFHAADGGVWAVVCVGTW
jgi:hypothetical protein